MLVCTEINISLSLFTGEKATGLKCDYSADQTDTTSSYTGGPLFPVSTCFVFFLGGKLLLPTKVKATWGEGNPP